MSSCFRNKASCRCAYHSRARVMDQRLARLEDQTNDLIGLNTPKTVEEQRLMQLEKDVQPISCPPYYSPKKLQELEQKKPPHFMYDVAVHPETKSLNRYISMMLRNNHLSGVLPLTQAAMMACIEDVTSQTIEIKSSYGHPDERLLPPSWISPLVPHCRCCVCTKLLVQGMIINCRHTCCWNCILDGVGIIMDTIIKDRNIRGGFARNRKFYLDDFPKQCTHCQEPVSKDDVERALKGPPYSSDVTKYLKERIIPVLHYLEEFDEDLADYKKRVNRGQPSAGALETMKNVSNFVLCT